MASSTSSATVPSSDAQLTEQARQAEALRAQEREFLFEQAREAEAKKWLPNLTGEMDEPQTGPYPQPTA